MKSRMHKFFVQIPFLAKAKKPEKVSYIFDLIYRDELKNKKSPYSRTKEYMKNGTRFNDFDLFYFEDKKMLKYCLGICKIIEYRHYSKKDISYKDEYQNSISFVKSLPKQPEVDKLITVKEIVSGRGLWE